QLLAELDFARHLVTGQVFPAPGDHVVRGEGGVALHDEQLHHFAGTLVRDADRRRLPDAFHLDNHGLDLVRINIEAGDVDHVLLPVFDIGEPARIHAPDIARAQPAARPHDPRGFLRLAPVAFHHLGAAYADLTGTAGPDIA